MSSDSSITAWIWGVKEGDEDALQKIWNRYLTELHSIAARKLHETHKHFGGPDDAVAEAMASFFFRVKDGKFPCLNDRSNLWPLLVTITKNKAMGFIRKESAQRRPRFTHQKPQDDHNTGFVEQILGKSPTPDDLISAEENAARLLSLLREDYQVTARLKLEGRTNAEIAEKQGLTDVRSIERRLAFVRAIWTKDFVVQRFCDAWDSGAIPSIDAFYNQCADDFSDAAPIAKVRRDLLLQLIKKDLEYRWRNSSIDNPSTTCETRTSRHYLERYPDLAAEKETLELLRHEFHVRHAFGDRPSQPKLLSQNSIEDQKLKKRFADLFA